MDRTLDVRTPESIAFSYELAGLGSRFLAVGIDLLLQIAVIVLIFWGIVAAASHIAQPAHRLPDNVATNVGVAIVLVVIFAVFFGYFIVFEAFWNGQTPGKRALGIRVVRDGGYPVDFGAALVRNLVRVGEMTLGFYAVSAAVAVASPENKRLGDMAAGTIVVREAKLSQGALLRDLREEPMYAPTAYVSGEERAIVKRFLERKDSIVADRRASIAHELAQRVRPRLPEDLQRLDDEALLERL